LISGVAIGIIATPQLYLPNGKLYSFLTSDIAYGSYIRLRRVKGKYNITLALPKYNCLQSKQYHF